MLKVMSKSCCHTEIPEPTPSSEKWIKRVWYFVVLLLIILIGFVLIFNF